ncbi:MAG: WD40 repeat domain-containing protein, partial [Anaerolineales bacterium]
SAFQEQDEGFFFGREEFSERLKRAVETHPLVAVIVGSSGSGKSSAVFAGLVPQLREQGDWLVAEFRPGSQPWYAISAAMGPLLEPELPETQQLIEIRKLADALTGQNLPLYDVLQRTLDKRPEIRRLLIIVDQFEELFSLCPDESIRRQFQDQVLAVVDAMEGRRKNEIVFLFTMRADFMGQALAHRPFADALQQASLLMGPMTREELRAVVEKPAEMQGARFEAGLVDRILDDVGDRPGNLPLLEFALTQLWQEQDNGWLTHEDYEAIGCVQGALARYADQVFDELEPGEQAQARRIFIQLVKPGEGTEDTRRVAGRSELAVDDWSLVQHLADVRLVVTGRDPGGEDTVEVIHEALIQRWGRFQGWMGEDRAFRSWQERLRTALRVWKDSQRDEQALLRGLNLTEAENWLRERTSELTNEEQTFVEESLAERRRREQAQQEQEQYELKLLQRSRRFLRGLVGVFIAATIVASGLTLFAFRQQREALRAYSMSLAAHVQNALRDNDSATALTLALVAADVGQTSPEVERVLRQAAYAPGARQRLDLAELLPDVRANLYSLAASPVDSRYLLGLDNGLILLWNPGSQPETVRLEGHTGLVRDLAFSPDGARALSASNDGTVIYWDLNKGQMIRRLTGHQGWVRTVAFSPAGRQAASGGFVGFDSGSVANPGELILWDLETGHELQRFAGHPSGVQSVAFSPDGTSLLASSGFFTDVSNTYSLILWDLESGEPIHTFEVDHDNYDVAIHPGGLQAVSGGDDNKIHIWDLASGQEAGTLEGHQSFITSLTYTPDGSGLVSIDSNGRVILWDLGTGGILMQSRIHDVGGSGWSAGDPPMPHLAVDFAGRQALSCAEDNRMVFWDLQDAGDFLRFTGHQAGIGSVAFTPDGQYAVTGSGRLSVGAPPAKDNTIRLWDVSSGELVNSFVGHADTVVALAFSDDGKWLLSGGMDGMLSLWEVESGQQVQSIHAQTGGVFSVAISPDQRLAVTGSLTGDVFPDDGVNLWDLTTGDLLFSLRGGINSTQVAFIDDGGKVIAVGPEKDVAIYSTRTGEELNRFGVPCCTGFALAPDGHSIFAVDNTERILREWDLEQDQMIRELGEYEGVRTRVVISPEGQKLLVSEFTGGLILRDAVTGDVIRRFSSGTFNMDIAVSPDGRWALSAGPHGTAILWNLDLPIEPNAVRAWVAENRYVRELSCSERATYQIEPLCE